MKSEQRSLNFNLSRFLVLIFTVLVLLLPLTTVYALCDFPLTPRSSMADYISPAMQVSVSPQEVRPGEKVTVSFAYDHDNNFDDNFPIQPAGPQNFKIWLDWRTTGPFIVDGIEVDLDSSIPGLPLIFTYKNQLSDLIITSSQQAVFGAIPALAYQFGSRILEVASNGQASGIESHSISFRAGTLAFYDTGVYNYCPELIFPKSDGFPFFSYTGPLVAVDLRNGPGATGTIGPRSYGSVALPYQVAVKKGITSVARAGRTHLAPGDEELIFIELTNDFEDPVDITSAKLNIKYDSNWQTNDASRVTLLSDPISDNLPSGFYDEIWVDPTAESAPTIPFSIPGGGTVVLRYRIRANHGGTANILYSPTVIHPDFGTTSGVVSGLFADIDFIISDAPPPVNIGLTINPSSLRLEQNETNATTIVSITNTGDEDLNNIILDENLPADVSLVSADPAPTVLFSGMAVQLRYEFEVTSQKEGRIEFNVTATGPAPASLPVQDTVTLILQPEVLEATIFRVDSGSSTVKEDSAHELRLRTKNIGDQDLSNLTLESFSIQTLSGDAEAFLESAIDISGTLPAGNLDIADFSVYFSGSGKVELRANLSATTPNSMEVNTTISKQYTVHSQPLSVELSLSPQTIELKETDGKVEPVFVAVKVTVSNNTDVEYPEFVPPEKLTIFATDGPGGERIQEDTGPCFSLPCEDSQLDVVGPLSSAGTSGDSVTFWYTLKVNDDGSWIISAILPNGSSAQSPLQATGDDLVIVAKFEELFNRDDCPPKDKTHPFCEPLEGESFLVFFNIENHRTRGDITLDWQSLQAGIVSGPGVTLPPRNIQDAVNPFTAEASCKTTTLPDVLKPGESALFLQRVIASKLEFQGGQPVIKLNYNIDGTRLNENNELIQVKGIEKELIQIVWPRPLSDGLDLTQAYDRFSHRALERFSLFWATPTRLILEPEFRDKLTDSAYQFTNFVVASWKGLTQIEKTALVLSLGLAKAPELASAIVQQIQNDIDQLSIDLFTGNYGAVAYKLGDFTGDILIESALSPILGAACHSIISGIKGTTRVARGADEVAEAVGRSVDDLELNDFRGDRGWGIQLSNPQAARLFGMTEEKLSQLLAYVEINDLSIFLRDRPRVAAELINSRKALPKPQSLKVKTVNHIDQEFLGYGNNQLGAVAYKAPELDWDIIKDLPAEIQDDITKRYNKRLKEWNDPELQKDYRGGGFEAQGVEVRSGSGNEGVRLARYSIDPDGTVKLDDLLVAGDNDVLHLRRANGKEFSDKEIIEVLTHYRYLENILDLEHGFTGNWWVSRVKEANIRDDTFANHVLGEKPVLQVAPGGTLRTAVFDPNHSIFPDPSLPDSATRRNFGLPTRITFLGEEVFEVAEQVFDNNSRVLIPGSIPGDTLLRTIEEVTECDVSESNGAKAQAVGFPEGQLSHWSRENGWVKTTSAELCPSGSVVILPSLILVDDAGAGSIVLKVSGEVGESVQPGNTVVLNPDGTNEETVHVVALGSLKLSAPLTYDHGVGEQILMLIQSSSQFTIEKGTSFDASGGYNTIGGVINAGGITSRDDTSGDIININGNYSGINGILKLDVGHTADILRIKGDSSGNTNLFINDTGLPAVPGKQILIISVTDDSNGNFILEKPIIVGNVAYFLEKEGNNWYLVSRLLTNTPIPTLSTWGLILLMGLILILGTQRFSRFSFRNRS